VNLADLHNSFSAKWFALKNPHCLDWVVLGFEAEWHGISGGGMWSVLDEGQPIDSLDWRQAKLVAITTDRSVPKVMGPVQYLRGAKIKRVINFIYTGRPGLRTSIEAAIPVRFVQ
jgi:hypothetical protein